MVDCSEIFRLNYMIQEKIHLIKGNALMYFYNNKLIHQLGDSRPSKIMLTDYLMLEQV